MLTRVARMYHEEGLPQREIAVRLSLSQSRVSRMLRAAAEAGIVRTVLTAPADVHAALRGSWINVLVTDAASARQLTEERLQHASVLPS
jgi:DNA-binding transcriptional regulator LsrR (DeoR family)